MSAVLVEKAAVNRWDNAYAKGSDKSYPNLDLVRLDAWFFGKKPGHLLEYGFGCGVNLIHLLESGYDIDAVDVSPNAKALVESKLAKRAELVGGARLQLLEAGQKRLPFADDSFDYIVCVSVLSLLGSKENVSLLLGEFHRVLKPSGKAILDINDSKASDFARDAEPLGDDVYLYPREPKPGDSQVRALCLPEAESFVSLIKPCFEIDDVGYSAHKLFHSEIHEFIVCCHKSE
jgi:SAM-dependent methyltransferase